MATTQVSLPLMGMSCALGFNEHPGKHVGATGTGQESR
jgi:hypothetical protein